MSYALSHSNSGLPYSHLITHILRAYPVVFPDTPISASCGITISSLHHMKIDFNSRFSCWTWRNIQTTNLGNPIRDVPLAPSPPTEVPESSSSSSHNTCAPLLKKLISLVKGSRRQSRGEYEHTKARQNKLYRLTKERHPDTYSALFEEAGSPSDPTAIWSGEDDATTADIDDGATQGDDDDDQADA